MTAIIECPECLETLPSHGKNCSLDNRPRCLVCGLIDPKYSADICGDCEEKINPSVRRWSTGNPYDQKAVDGD